MSRALFRAIQLRRWVRHALDIDDMDSVRVLNRQADAAITKLSREEFSRFCEWAFQ